MIELRAATEDDRAWGAALMAASEPWQTLRRDEASCRAVLDDVRNRCVVAWVDGRAAGLAVVDPRGFAGAPYLKAIVVDPPSRSAGVGSALLDRVEREYGVPARNLFLCVSSFNERASALYQRRGYVRIGAIEDYIVDGAAEIILRKRFSAS
jgi:ribosomal protein S18 acetylase RimI-like enzyme